MSEINIQEILNKVRENKEALERSSAELDEARDTANKALEEAAALRGQLDEKDEAIQDLLTQNITLQEQASEAEASVATLQAALEEKEQLAAELNELLK